MESTRISDALRDYRKGFRPLLGWLGSLGRFELFVALIVVGAVVTSFFAVPRMSIAGSPLEPLVEELGEDASPPGVRISTPTPSVEGLDAPPQSPIIETPDGFVIRPGEEGSVSLPIRLKVADDDRALLRLWVYGSRTVPVRVELLRRGEPLRVLGRPGVWTGELFDVTEDLANGPLTVEVTARNDGPTSALFFDRVAGITAPPNATPRADPLLVGVWLALLTAAALGLARRLRPHWPLIPVVAFAGYLFWREVERKSVLPLEREASELWASASSAGWFDLETGLLSGTFGDQSALAVQLFHALGAFLGTGTGSALAASALVGVAAVTALYWLGQRVAGPVSAVVVASLALLADPFREAATTGTAVTTMVLAAALFAYAVHASLAVASPSAVVALAAAGAFAVLAEALWLIGVVGGIVILTLLYAPHRRRLRTVGAAMLALAILLVPSRVSVAAQHEDDVFGDLADRATVARGAERTSEALPPDGDRVGLTEYVFGDRSIGVVVGEALTGASDALAAFAVRDGAGMAGLFGFVLTCVGATYLLIVPRLRMLVIVPAVVALPALVLVGREGIPAFAGGVPIWPAFLAGGGLLAYVLVQRVWGSAAVRVPDSASRVFVRRDRGASMRPRSLRPQEVDETTSPVERPR